MKPKTLLVIGTHMDDCEAGAGGTIFKALEQGVRVVMVNTIGDYSNRHEMAGTDVQAARERVIALAAEMGAEKILLDYKYHEYPDDLAARREMAAIVARVQPDIALIHHWEDYWNDHRITAMVARDALIHADCLCPEVPVAPCRNIYAFTAGPHQTYAFEPDVFVDVSPYIERIAWARMELDKIMSPGLADEQYVRARVRAFRAGESALSQEMELSGHAEAQIARLRCYGDKTRTLYAEPFMAVFKKTRELW